MVKDMVEVIASCGSSMIDVDDAESYCSIIEYIKDHYHCVE